MTLARWSLPGIAVVLSALMANACSSSSPNNAATPSEDVTVSNTCYRSPSDLVTYGITCALTTQMTGSPPAWISGNFDCVEVDSSGATHEFSTYASPNYKTKYYVGPNNENSMPSGTSANPNTISNQSYTVNIPKTPALGATPTASGYDLVGVATNGVAIYNNQAAPGDSLANELVTMDYGNGHPTNIGSYHYHIEPCYLSNNDGNLVGVMRDGFPIFGRKEPGTSATPVYDDNCSVATATTVANCRPYPSQMPNFHCHAVAGGYPACHYHVTTTDPFIIEYYAGTPGNMTP